MSRRIAADQAGIEAAARALRAGRLVAFPTETVYGLGADASNDRAVARIFEAKRRPRFNPLIVHLPDRTRVQDFVVWPPLAERLAAAFWPGALTLVLERRPGAALAELVSAGGPTVALRVPAHPVAARLLELADRPVAAPSANPAGRISATTADHVEAGLGAAVDLILDGGACPLGLESTVVDLTGEPARLLRAGGLSRDLIEPVSGPLGPPSPDGGGRRSPGMLESHYAPRLPVRLDASEAGADEALLAFGPAVPEGAAMVRNLSPRGDLVEAAANLFAMLHDLDRSGARRIAVMPIPGHGLGEAILDRLRRAAAPRGR